MFGYGGFCRYYSDGFSRFRYFPFDKQCCSKILALLLYGELCTPEPFRDDVWILDVRREWYAQIPWIAQGKS